MAEPNVLQSLPDRAMKQSEIERLGESEAVDWTEPLRTGARQWSGMVSGWILETNGTAHVLLYEIDGWVSKGSFETEGMDPDEKYERGRDVLGL